MNKLRSLFFIVGLMVIASLSIACGASSESQGPTKMSEVPRISAEELKERLDNGEVIVVVDTRSSGYKIKHIAGAISVPSVRGESPLDELPLDHGIVFYCTCPNEATSARRALTLYKNGYTNVSALLGGMSAWEAAGYPMEKS